MAPVPAPLLLVIAGPAGSGKSTLCDRLVAERPDFSRVVTTTTRPPRAGEIDGVHYHFSPPRNSAAGLPPATFSNGRMFTATVMTASTAPWPPAGSSR